MRLIPQKIECVRLVCTCATSAVCITNQYLPPRRLLSDIHSGHADWSLSWSPVHWGSQPSIGSTIAGPVRVCKSHGKDHNNDARSSIAWYGSPARQSGDRKSSVPTLSRKVVSELMLKQLTSKSFKKTSEAACYLA